MVCDIGVIGLAVMGQNLILNMNDHGFVVAAYNRSAATTGTFINGPANNTKVIAAYTVEELVKQLKSPRVVMLMVKAGGAVDDTIKQLLPLLEQGDVIIDGGNSNYSDSQQRSIALDQKGIFFVGAGVSGGEEGARFGPSIMPGGHPQAWPLVKDILQTICARTKDGSPCCEWVGKNGAGHFVKMVHNGIEYGDMQIICEVYHFMKALLEMDNPSMQAVFREWNKGQLESYLIEITADILAYRKKGFSLDLILDSAGQKGTGKWTVFNALDFGTPVTLIGEAVFARFLSALKQQRTVAADILGGPPGRLDGGDRERWIKLLGEALLASKIVSYAQGFMLMQQASDEYGWALDYGNIAQLWRGGCIIRSVFLDDIKSAYVRNPELNNLMLDEYFRETINRAQTAWRKVVAKGVEHGLPLPAMSSALAFYDGYRCRTLPANLLQAQRDYFGAHTYERVDQPRGERFHTNWTGEGGQVSSGDYNA